MDKLTLKWRVFAFMLGFSALLLLILWLLQTVFLTDMYKLVRKNEINKAIALVRQNIDNPNLNTIIRDLQIESEISVMPAHEFAPPIWWKNEMDNGEKGKPKPRMEVIEQTEEFTLQNSSKVSFTFFAMITPVEATVSTLKTQLYMITAIMILLSITIGIIISRAISKPIEKINKSAKILASGNYNTHFNGQGFLEIRELADTLNTAATELSKVESLRRELMANVSHDLRTPLALIYSYAEMMSDFPDEITPEQIKTIMDETKRLTSLVNDILDVSQLETGNIGINKLQYCLSESMAATINRTEELIKADGYVIDFDYSEKVYVNADEVKITQAFYNLLTNAINYSGDDKKIIVRQRIIDNYVRIEVADNGDGIVSDNLPYVWDRYYKSDKKHKRAITGTGLGLSIVKKIIDMHGGKYGVSSEFGKGSIFWFEIILERNAYDTDYFMK